MNIKLVTVLMACCLLQLISRSESSFIKPNNVPRVGRSNEEVNPFDQGGMGYVIKTNKNIPRMGRRNYDSENRFDIPKFYQLPVELEQEEAQSMNQEPVEVYFPRRLDNMKR